MGFSLQYELTFTNVLNMLDLGGIPIRSHDRRPEHPLVIAGGPVATQPEPMAPFVDGFLIGDAEERLPELMREHARLREEGIEDREEILVRLQAGGGLYCPALYDRDVCPRSGLAYVSRARRPEVPLRTERAFLDDVNRFPFPDDSPVPAAEAIFDRTAVEIARGCTEGCRFCQAGMIYRPVRERDPKAIVDTVVSAVEKGGYDEASLTSLSTADYSCVAPLIKEVMKELVPRRVSLGISSLRAYGLPEEVLDDISQVKATGLTFAPEAGSQRMRDVVNKNVSEQDIYETCRRVFSRGWDRAKLYFMIGLPTEEDEDVLGIADMGRQARHIGDREAKRRVRITVSVSSHVPKPHTPFQWCAQDSMAEIERKQDLLQDRARQDGFRLRTHDRRVSHLEGILARGDIRTARLVEIAFRLGARFDGWDEQLRWDLWEQALERWESETGALRGDYLGTIPVGRPASLGARGRRTRRRLPAPRVPALAQGPRLAALREARLDAGPPHERVGRPRRRAQAGLLPLRRRLRPRRHADRADRVPREPGRRGTAQRRRSPAPGGRRRRAPRVPGWFPPSGASRPRLPGRAGGLSGALRQVRPHGAPGPRRADPHPPPGPPPRRPSDPLQRGASPPARSSVSVRPPARLQSLGEFCEFALTEELPEARVLEALRGASEEGLRFTELVRVLPGEPKLSRWIAALRYAVLLAADLEPASVEARLEAFASADSWPVALTRRVKAKSRRRGPRAPAAPGERTVEVNLRDFVDDVHLAPAGAEAALLGCSADRLNPPVPDGAGGQRFHAASRRDHPRAGGFEPVNTEILRTACEPARSAGLRPASPAQRAKPLSPLPADASGHAGRVSR